MFFFLPCQKLRAMAISVVAYVAIKDLGRQLRWSSGLRAGLWFPSSRVRTRPKPLDFFLCKKSPARLPSEGKLNNLSHVPTLGHVKDPFSRG
jgi:hypothetical protein